MGFDVCRRRKERSEVDCGKLTTQLANIVTPKGTVLHNRYTKQIRNAKRLAQSHDTFQ